MASVAVSIPLPGVVLEVKQKSGVVTFQYQGKVAKARFSKQGFLHNGLPIAPTATFSSFLKVGDPVLVVDIRPLNNESEQLRGIHLFAEVAVTEEHESLEEQGFTIKQANPAPKNDCATSSNLKQFPSYSDILSHASEENHSSYTQTKVRPVKQTTNTISCIDNDLINDGLTDNNSRPMQQRVTDLEVLVIDGVIYSLNKEGGTDPNAVSFRLNGKKEKALFHRNKVTVNGNRISHSQALRLDLRINMAVRVWKLSPYFGTRNFSYLASIDVNNLSLPQSHSSVEVIHTIKPVVAITSGQIFQGKITSYSKSCDCPLGLAEFKHCGTTYLTHFVITELKIGKRIMNIGFFSALAHIGMAVTLTITKSSHSNNYSFNSSAKINISNDQLKVYFLKHETESNSFVKKSARVKIPTHSGTIVSIGTDAFGKHYPQVVSIIVKKKERLVFIPVTEVTINGICLKHYQGVRLKNYLTVGANIEVTHLNPSASTTSSYSYEGSVAIRDASVSLPALLGVPLSTDKTDSCLHVDASSRQLGNRPLSSAGVSQCLCPPHSDTTSSCDSYTRSYCPPSKRDKPHCLNGAFQEKRLDLHESTRGILQGSNVCPKRKMNARVMCEDYDGQLESKNNYAYNAQADSDDHPSVQVGLPPELDISWRRGQKVTQAGLFTARWDAASKGGPSIPETKTSLSMEKYPSKKITFNQGTQTISTGNIIAFELYVGGDG